MADDGDVGLPRWVKITGLSAAVVVLVVVVLLLTGGPGGHGPSRHGSAGSEYPTVTPPAGHAAPTGNDR